MARGYRARDATLLNHDPVQLSELNRPLVVLVKPPERNRKLFMLTGEDVLKAIFEVQDACARLPVHRVNTLLPPLRGGDLVL